MATVRLEKGTDGSWFLNGWVCRAVGPPRVTPQMVLDEASRLVPSAPIGLAPRARTLVNIQTVMWLDAGRRAQLPTATILGRPVAIALRLDHVDWAFGDGDTGVSTSPGKRYDGKGDPCTTKQCPDYFGHTYTTTGTMTISATASWRVTFRVGAGAAAPIPGTVTGPAGRASVQVLEARGVLVPDPTSN